MRLNYDDAVLRRADLASLQVSAQTALRIVLAIAFVWALITTCLVWYWMGFYGVLRRTSTRALGAGLVLHRDHSCSIRIHSVQRQPLHRRQHIRVPEPRVLLRRLIR
jgi:hypothetical protein